MRTGVASHKPNPVPKPDNEPKPEAEEMPELEEEDEENSAKSMGELE